MEAADETIRQMFVPDPSMSDAQFLHEQALERERAEKKGRKPNLDIGKVPVNVNLATTIGGLWRVPPYDPPRYHGKRHRHHERAAAWFKSSYEALYGGMAPAIDAGKVRVDTSIMAHDNGAVARLDMARDLLDLIEGRNGTAPVLTKAAANRIIACVVLGIPSGDNAPVGPSGKPNWRHVEREVDMLLDALNQVAVFKGYATA